MEPGTDREFFRGLVKAVTRRINKRHLSHSTESAFLELMDENRGPERARGPTSVLPVASSGLWPCSFWAARSLLFALFFSSFLFLR